jgi:tRNA pseudouridine32 synthase/23S rRNA pseudouridine746 synthase
MFQKRSVRKVYEALAAPLQGRDLPFTYRSRMVDGDKFFVMREVEGEPNSETLVELIERRADVALYRLHPHTGRKHQLRLHMASLGAPILNDPSIRSRCRARATTSARRCGCWRARSVSTIR